MKLDLKSKIKRLVIYFFYDADGIVDRYVPYMLKDIKKNCSELFVVCNGKLTSDGRKIFKELTPNILVRENIGFDVWAYKEAMEQYGWERLAQYDEVVLMNFTIYGPLYPFVEMFKEMDKRDVDFWGITKHHGFPFDPFGTIPCGYIPEHIQSSFIAIRSQMINSEEFHKYWDNMPQINSYGEAVGKHEAIFTEKFRNCGFISDVYIQTDDLKKYTHYPLMIKPLELIKNRRCPVFKRKSFSNEYYEFLNCCVGEPTVEMYEYIRDYLDYDLNMVWENLLRVENMSDIKNRMHLNCVLPRDKVLDNQKKNCIKKIALIFHIYYEDQIDDCLKYSLSMPEYSDVYITTSSPKNEIILQEKTKILMPRNVSILKIENRGRDVSALLVAASDFVKKYDLVCFAHDKKTVQFEPYTIGESFAYKCLQNILGSKEYVENIILTFQEQPRLGIFMPPPPNHASFYGVLGTEWGDNFNKTKELAEDLSINVNINQYKEPISPLGTMFWFRPDALEPLFNKRWKYQDFPEEPNNTDATILHAIERIYGFVSQSRGYYSVWGMHDHFAAIELTNYHFMLRELSMSVYSTIGHQQGFNFATYNLVSQLSFRKILKKKIKSKIPKSIWNSFKKLYHLFGGKKWIG